VTTIGDTAPDPAPRRSARTHVALWTWLALGVIVALVGTLILVKVVGGSSGPVDVTSLTATSPAVLHEVSSVPPSIFDQVGITSPTVPLVAPQVLPDEKALDFTSAAGTRLPGIVFWGAEFCSFCAAERWPLIIALSRFGTFDSLYDMESSSTDFAPSTATFTFYTAEYKSRYVVFRPYEVQSDAPTTTSYARLMHAPKRSRSIVRAFDPTLQYPFVDIGNTMIAREAAFSPLTLSGMTREQIATALSDPASPIAQAILASANMLTAGICAADGDRPSTVCDSSGVTAADTALTLSH
jgi:hypothetical protein